MPAIRAAHLHCRRALTAQMTKKRPTTSTQPKRAPWKFETDSRDIEPSFPPPLPPLRGRSQVERLLKGVLATQQQARTKLVDGAQTLIVCLTMAWGCLFIYESPHYRGQNQGCLAIAIVFAAIATWGLYHFIRRFLGMRRLRRQAKVLRSRLQGLR